MAPFSRWRTDLLLSRMRCSGCSCGCLLVHTWGRSLAHTYMGTKRPGGRCADLQPDSLPERPLMFPVTSASEFLSIHSLVNACHPTLQFWPSWRVCKGIFLPCGFPDRTQVQRRLPACSVVACLCCWATCEYWVVSFNLSGFFICS